VARTAETDYTASDEAAFRSLFLTHWQCTYRAAYRIVGDPEESQDIAQEAFLRLLRRPFSDQREHNVAGWLYTVATNLGLNAVRGRARRTRREQATPAETLAPDALAEVVAEEERDLVRSVLAEMPERQRACLLLRHGGLSYAEVALQLDVAPGSVGTLLARAEREFRRLYEETARRQPTI
jgi:RNA polymerase sigma-70 factor (ECF subfamily)